ncbi:peptidoglycan bridge formation glycyltransferase FemA/FemB family protein [Salirhabdus sp. Marseille-P4669]|uniref:peptidoglycan bridge formation glycyltransferase FemA/FemB family protein n=1 Tax=Salirhabdus sp. Marseille-P4669 TaxID=2042310 RepID=UPI000C7DFF71|nr:peptidoglycan bridge formation glycyltransferase FemA/FemB family protein [Salirhabdus sp. Marseille-P4669]
MTQIPYKRGLVRMLDVYGSTNVEDKMQADVMICSNVLVPSHSERRDVPRKGCLPSFGKTLILDLKKTEEELFAAIHKNARYKINRAMKRDSIYHKSYTNPSDNLLERFIAFFDTFSKNKKIPKANMGRLKELRAQGAILLSFVEDEQEQILCSHVHVVNGRCCSLLHSASARFDNRDIRNVIGRANRYLHWMDICEAKSMGVDWYDFGGLFVDSKSAEEEHINRFKKEFGGQEVDVDKRIYPNSIIGKMVVFLFWVKMRKRPEFLRGKAKWQQRYSISDT